VDDSDVEVALGDAHHGRRRRRRARWASPRNEGSDDDRDAEQDRARGQEMSPHLAGIGDADEELELSST
jgi:hypothetical protein